MSWNTLTTAVLNIHSFEIDADLIQLDAYSMKLTATRNTRPTHNCGRYAVSSKDGRLLQV
jgi:hypothetical protein